MSLNRPEVTDNRMDISRFFLHLTRDDRNTDENGAPARDNFLRILDERQILNIRPHCLHAARVPNEKIEAFRVACFTETPLTEIRHLLDIPGRRIDLQPYGFVFKRRFLMAKGAQQAVYINNYFEFKRVRQSYDSIFERALRTKFAGDDWASFWEHIGSAIDNLALCFLDSQPAIFKEDAREELMRKYDNIAYAYNRRTQFIHSRIVPATNRATFRRRFGPSRRPPGPLPRTSGPRCLVGPTFRRSAPPPPLDRPSWP
jgi:hypothetical protein